MVPPASFTMLHRKAKSATGTPVNVTFLLVITAPTMYVAASIRSPITEYG